MKKALLLAALLLLLLFPGTAEGFTISSSYNNLLSNPEGQGILDRLMKEAFRRLGREVEIVYAETDRSLIDVNAGVFDADINRIEGLEQTYPHLVRVPEPNMEMQFTAFVKKALPLASWADLAPYRVGLVRGWKILEERTRSLPEVYTVPTEVHLFKMLDAGRIDAALYANRTGHAVVESLGLTGIWHIESPLETHPMYLYLHESRADLAEPLAVVLREMKADGSYEAIMGENR